MPADGKLRTGEVLDDWQAPHGYVTEIVSITSGRMPTPIDLNSPMRGSSASEACALFGGSKGSAHSTPAKKGQP